MRNKKPLYIFLLKALILYVLWNVLYSNYISTDTAIEEKMTSVIASMSSSLINIWGFNTYTIDFYADKHFEYSEIILNNKPLVLIANSCNGITLLVLFVGFIVAYPGNWKVKGVYIFAGSIIIFVINLIRVQILLFNMIYNKDSFDFNHKYTYTIAVYFCVFMLWMIWANRYSNIKLSGTN